MNKLVKSGVFTEVVLEPPGVAVAVVTDAFMQADFKTKESMIVLASRWAYHTPRSVHPTGLVILRDAKSNKKVGQFDAAGLVME